MTARFSRPLAAALVTALIIGSSAPSVSAAAVPVTHGEPRLHRRAIPSPQSSRPQLSSSLCLSKGCVNAAYQLLNKMDTSVDPCDDFYAFACGSFLDRTVIPDEKSSVSQFSLLSDDLKLQMRKLIDSPITSKDSPATVLVKKHFTSCMDKEGIEYKGLKPVKDILARMGGWPVVQGDLWNQDQFHWTEVLYRNRKIGYSNSYMFQFSVDADIKNYTRRMINLNDVSLGFGRKYLIKGFSDSDVQGYFHYMVDMAVLLGAEPDKAKSEMEDALRFEIQLANISLPAEERRNISQLYNRKTLDEMSLLAPNIPWLIYANKQLEDAGHKVFANESVNVQYPDYFKKLNGLLETTPKSCAIYEAHKKSAKPQEVLLKVRKIYAGFRVQANYLLWRVARASVNQLNLAARDARLKFSAQVYGKTEHKPRWKDCLDGTISSFHIGAGSLYVRNHFDEDSKKAALELVADLHQQFDIMLRELTWMDDSTKQNAMEKSKTIEYYIAYPDELLNDTLVAEYYDGLSISDNDYFQNALNLGIFFINKSFRKLREPVDKKDWKRHSRTAIVNAFYSFQDNSITFPAGILQGVFYSNDRPKYLNYGAIGFIIGHEITHGFDDQGRQFDAEGELKEWWQPETRTKFLEGAQCIIDQYSNITIDRANMSVNGIITQGENIADNGGMKIARRAYELYQQKAGREQALPGLQQYTNEQMFWVGSTSAWCSVNKEERLRLVLLTNSHAPDFVRINTSLRNTPQFAADWQCPAGSPMNPADRCGVW